MVVEQGLVVGMGVVGVQVVVVGGCRGRVGMIGDRGYGWVFVGTVGGRGSVMEGGGMEWIAVEQGRHRLVVFGLVGVGLIVV